MRTRTRNLRGLLALLQEFGVTSYEHEGTKLTMAPVRTPSAAEAPARRGRPATTAVDRAKAMMDAAGVDSETASDLAASLGLES